MDKSPEPCVSGSGAAGQRGDRAPRIEWKQFQRPPPVAPGGIKARRRARARPQRARAGRSALAIGGWPGKATGARGAGRLARSTLREFRPRRRDPLCGTCVLTYLTFAKMPCAENRPASCVETGRTVARDTVRVSTPCDNLGRRTAHSFRVGDGNRCRFLLSTPRNLRRLTACRG